MSGSHRDRRAQRRAAAARREALPRSATAASVLGQQEASTALHEERLQAVLELLLAGGARAVLDLGCGAGVLLQQLAAEPRFTRVVGLDTSFDALCRAEAALRLAGLGPGDRVSLRHGSLTDPGVRLEGFDAVVMVETIEHVDPAELSLLERAVFAASRPPLVVVTTPNREYNPRFGLAHGELRRPDHRFEWTRAELRDWAAGVGQRQGYRTAFQDVGPVDAWLGSPTQIAVFRRGEECGRPERGQRRTNEQPSNQTH